MLRFLTFLSLTSLECLCLRKFMIKYHSYNSRSNIFNIIQKFSKLSEKKLYGSQLDIFLNY